MDLGSDLCPPSPPPSSPIGAKASSRSRQIFPQDATYSPPPSSPMHLTQDQCEAGKIDPRPSTRTLSFDPDSSSSMKKKKKKKPAVVYWKLTTMTSPDFSLSRLTERQQLSLIRKKQELGLKPDERPPEELAKILSPYLMDQMDGEYHSWAKKDSSDVASAQPTAPCPPPPTRCPSPIPKRDKPTRPPSFFLKKNKRQIVSDIDENHLSNVIEPSVKRYSPNRPDDKQPLDDILPPPPPPSTPVGPLDSTLIQLEPNPFLKPSGHWSSTPWRASLPGNLQCTDTLHRYHYTELQRWLTQLQESYIFRVSFPCCDALMRTVKEQLDLERTISMEAVRSCDCKHLDAWRVSALGDLLVRQHGERTVLDFFENK